VAQSTEPYGDIGNLIEDSLDLLARRRGYYPGADLAAIRQLIDLVDEAEAALDRRVYYTRDNDHSWHCSVRRSGRGPASV